MPDFWKTWHQFEVKHGNEDTFKEMLRIKRSVQAQYNTEASYLSAQLSTAQQAGDGAAADVPAREAAQSAMAHLEAAAMEGASRMVGFVSGGVAQNGKVVERTALSSEPVLRQNNPDEIVMDEEEEEEEEKDKEDEEEEEEEDEGGPVKKITTKAVPAAVFGGVGQEEARLGARERFKRKRNQ